MAFSYKILAVGFLIVYWVLFIPLARADELSEACNALGFQVAPFFICQGTHPNTTCAGAISCSCRDYSSTTRYGCCQRTNATGQTEYACAQFYIDWGVTLEPEPTPEKQPEPEEPVRFIPQVTIPGSITIGGKEITFRKGEGIEITGATAAQYFAVFYRFFVAALAVIAIVMVMWGGFKRIMAAGSPERIKNANENIIGAITGVIIALISYTLLSLINPALVSFKSLAIDPILRQEIDSNRSGYDITPDNFTSSCETQPIEGTNGVPLYKQGCYDNVPFGPNSQPCGGDLESSSIKSSGCGPTSLAMVLSFYGKSVDPIEAAKTWADNGFRACVNKNGVIYGENYGTALASQKVLGKYGMRGEYVSWSKTIELLQQNKPVIVSVGPSIFTSRGHFIVLTGISGDKIYVNDSAKDCYTINGVKDCSRMVDADYIKEKVKGEGGAYYIHP